MDGYQQLGQPAARSGAAQELWDELVHARGRPQIDEPGQDVDELCLRIDSGQLAVPTSSTVWVSRLILDAAIRVSLMARRHPEARTISSRGGGGLSRALGSPAADLAAARRTFVGGMVGRFTTKKKSGNPLDDQSGWGSLSDEWKI